MEKSTKIILRLTLLSFLFLTGTIIAGSTGHIILMWILDAPAVILSFSAVLYCITKIGE